MEFTSHLSRVRVRVSVSASMMRVFTLYNFPYKQFPYKHYPYKQFPRVWVRVRARDMARLGPQG